MKKRQTTAKEAVCRTAFTTDSGYRDFQDNNYKPNYMKKKFAFALALASAVQLQAQTAPNWLRWCAISPDGKNIAFTYSGDIYLVPANGGEARQLTANTAYDYAPVWSPDSKHLAFSSTREGSKDVFVASINGGTPQRVTTHSGSEVPVAFLDDQTIVFKSTLGTPTADNIQFPSSTYHRLYKVNVKGGRPELFSEWAMDNPSIGKKGILYEDIKGYEDYWRKHQTSSIARDIWMFDGKNYLKITSFKGEDRSPVWTADGDAFFYLSEQNGTFNVFHRPLQSNAPAQQLTFHKDNPVRFLSASAAGTLCYSYDGEIYTLLPGQQPQKVNIRLTRDDMQREVIRQLHTSGVSQVSISPENKEIAFILKGDVYVTSTDYATTKQITNTPERERSVDFAPDGRSLVYASERDGKWQIYQATIANKEDKNFTYASAVKEERLTDGSFTAFQPLYNPKGGEVAFLKDRTEICIINLKNKKVRTAMPGKFQYSYTDGDQSFAWSPDGKWLLSEYIGNGGWNNKDIALVKADGSGEIHNLTNSGYSEGSPKWVLGGKAMIFQSDRAGYRSHGSWGSLRDEYILFFDRDAYDRFRMNKEDLALLEEQEKLEKEAKEKAEKEKAEKESKKKDKKKKDTKKDVKKDVKKEDKKSDELQLDLSHLDEWVIRLTPYSTSLGDVILDKEGTKLYYVAPFEGSPSLWIQDLKEHSNSLKMKGIGWASFDLDKEGKNAYMANWTIQKLDIASGRTSNIPFEAFHTEQPAATRAYLFDHIWHQTKEKLYDPNMNGADWDKIYKTYSKYLPHISNNYDFAEMASEMLGELNVSHTGCRFGGYGGAMSTACLGVFYDESYKGDGLKIKEVIKGSPLEAGKKPVKAGAVVLAIDGQEIKAGQDYFPLLEGKTGRYTRLTVEMDGKRQDIVVKPISAGAQEELLYKRWVNRNKEIVERLSKGRLAYVHIKEMNASSFQELYKDLLSDKNRNREAVIVDTRHNGGGWLHDDIIALLTGKLTMQYKPRGQYIGNDPFDRWTKPSCMLICEDNYSNAHGTPWYYKAQGVGKLIGAPVPGTMTAVWWEGIEGGMVFGIPQVGAYDMDGNVLENQLLMPDIEVYNNPADVLGGKDSQLERAVQEMLK